MARALLLLMLGMSLAQAEWRVALPGWKYEFPRDHGSHPDFKTEWWYFTGNLQAADGREFGYQLTFFRQGITGGDEDFIALSRFVTRDIKLAHFAVTDLANGKFLFDQKLSRGTFGEAGFADGNRLAWIENWSCEFLGDGGFRLRASQAGASIDLRLKSVKPIVIHGENGVSQKSDGEGRASHYYSLTRLLTEGEVRIGQSSIPVKGNSWFDHEWATNQLSEDQSGWDWLSLQLDDNSELMLFQIRLRNGGRDPYSGGTYIDSRGVTTTIADADFTLLPGAQWQSPESKASYPVEWTLAVPKLGLSLHLKAAHDAQELNLKPISYWEGAVRAEGTRQAVPVSAKGYLEMTGYAGPITGMQAPAP